jgi:hypothetical protein
VYCINQNWIDYEKLYTMIEKKNLSLVFTTSKLRHYLLNTEVQVVMDFDPLKHLFNKYDLSRCLAKWVMLLIEFDLNFFSQK